ncbi:MAG TPA: YetF domain-containing protein [Chloroflexota bacterium]|nr:YetF domain-containing protein [Chloroflexota bacterium]
MDDLLTLAVPVWNLALRCVVIYGALLVGLRLTGKRELGQFTVFDLVLVLLVANAVQPAMTGPDSSLVGGLVIIVVLLAVNALVGQLRLRSPRLNALLRGHPAVLVEDGHWLDAALRHEGVDREDVLMAIREHGVDSVEDVKLAVLELDGTVSVVPKDSPTIRTRRRVRYARHGL